MLRSRLLRAAGRLLLLLAFAGIAIGVPLGWHMAAGKGEAATADCHIESLERATVHNDIKITTEGRTYPRLISELTIRIPTSNRGAENLLRNEADPEHRRLVGCLLYYGKNSNELRADDTRIDYSNEIIEVTDRVWVDLGGPGTYWAGTTTVVVGTEPWTLQVAPPPVLYTAEWDVTIVAPDGWLASPRPWEAVHVSQGRLRWSELSPSPGDSQVVATDMQPDGKAFASFTGTTPAGFWWSWGVNTATALGTVLLTLYLLHRKRHGALDAKRAMRVVWPLLVLLIATAVGDVIIRIAKDRQNVEINWLLTHWWFNVAIVPLVTVLAFLWWLPRSFAALIGAVMGGATAALWQMHGYLALSMEGSLYSDALEVGISFLVSFVFLAGVGKAFEVLLLNGQSRKLPTWLLIVSGAAATLLVIERYALAWWNAQQQEWLGERATVAITDVYRRFPWNLVAESKWLPLGLTAAAIWYFVSRRKYTPTDTQALASAVILLAIGPIWWDIVVLGWAVPIWPFTLGLMAILAIALRTRRFSVLGRAGVGRDLDLTKLRTKATAWYATPTTEPGPSPVDVLLAAGPTGEPVGNMVFATRLGISTAIVTGIGLVAMGAVVSPLLTPEHSASVLMRLVTEFEWHAFGLIVAIAATGLAWQHLPGRRGVVKVLPIVFLFALGPGLHVSAALLTDVKGWDSLTGIALFALVLVIVGVRMDKASLDGITIQSGSRLQRFFGLYGLENLSAKLTAFLTPLLAVFAIWSAINGGDVSPPNTEPPRPNPIEQQTGKG